MSHFGVRTRQFRVAVALHHAEEARKELMGDSGSRSEGGGDGSRSEGE
jgi:hypothetical protein